MKNYYELKNEDLKKYKKEFRKSTYGMKVTWFDTLGLVIFFIGYILSLWLTLTNDIELFNLWVACSNFMVYGGLIICTITELIGHHSFLRWLRIKHKIEF